MAELDWTESLHEVMELLHAGDQILSPVESRLLAHIIDSAPGDLAIAEAPVLANRLRKIANQLSDDQRFALDRLLNVAGGAVAPTSGALSSDAYAASAFRVIQLYFLNERERTLTWHGRPNFMTGELLQNLQREAKQQRKLATRRNHAYVSTPGTVASGMVFFSTRSRFSQANHWLPHSVWLCDIHILRRTR
jgi:hypothetical protein